jgi:hypothetical protein
MVVVDEPEKGAGTVGGWDVDRHEEVKKVEVLVKECSSK